MMKSKKCLSGYQGMFECDHCEDLRLPGLQEYHSNYDLRLTHN